MMREYFSLVGNVFCFCGSSLLKERAYTAKQETVFKHSVEVVSIKLPRNKSHPNINNDFIKSTIPCSFYTQKTI